MAVINLITMKKIILFILVVLSIFFYQKGMVFAQETGKNIVISKETIIDHDYLAAGEIITISGTINGDVYVLAQNLTVDGTINGDILTACQTFNLLGTVTEDVRVASGDIFVNGLIGRNLSVVAGNLTLTPQAKIGGNLVFLGNYLDLQSVVANDVQLFARKATINSQIGGNLNARVEEISLEKGAAVSKNFSYQSAKKANISDEATIAGETSFRPVTEKTQPKFKDKIKYELKLRADHLKKLNLYLEIFGFLISLVLGLIFCFLFPKRYQGMAKQLSKSFWPALGLGVLLLISFFVLFLFLLVSLIGIPIALFLVPSFIFFLYLSRTFTAYFVAQKIFSKSIKDPNQKLLMLTGLMVYYVLRLIPVVRTITIFLFVALGLGAFFLDQRSLHKSK